MKKSYQHQHHQQINKDPSKVNVNVKEHRSSSTSSIDVADTDDTQDELAEKIVRKKKIKTSKSKTSSKDGAAKQTKETSSKRVDSNKEKVWYLNSWILRYMQCQANMSLATDFLYRKFS